MNLNQTNNLTFGWNVIVHEYMTKKALKSLKDSGLSEDEINDVGKYSKEPDIIKAETVDRCARHFYDILHEDPSFGTIDDDLNNAMSGYLNKTNEAILAAKAGNRKEFLKKISHAVHYLQDASTPMHVDHGNYFSMLLRLPMHIKFERGKKIGATARLDILEKGFKSDDLPVSNLEGLFKNTAYFAVQTENKVKYTNVKKWPEIQQRCFDRGINASKAYFDYIMKFLPKKV